MGVKGMVRGARVGEGAAADPANEGAGWALLQIAA